ncbi:transcriptional repressor [Actinomadura fulvescens]|uniref:Fur family transcriptional regulator n=1 Tax=Actinomadura fulvescens TaxID=46160 RepID=A0ABP6CWX9_9ACTN
MEDHARDLLARGITVTPRRLQVLAALARQSGPRSANELHVDLRTHGTRVGLTTVYRTLAVLSRTDLVHAMELDGETVYLRCGERRHAHLVCRACGFVLHADVARLDTPETFRVEEVYGTCGSCLQESQG